MVSKLFILFCISQVVCQCPRGMLGPSDFTAKAVDSTSIVLSWRAPDDTSNLDPMYTITVTQGGRNKYHFFTSTEGKISNLQPSTKYNLKLTAFCKIGNQVNPPAYISATTKSNEEILKDKDNADASIGSNKKN
uniref:Fibronectin type III domain n=1 Tax=Schistocephalus solidus TaxID=70667 RepID=A0A0X3Q3B3_SCHSO